MSIEKIQAERDALQATLTKERIETAFKTSKFVADRLAVPADILAARFASAFTFEDGRLVGKDSQGRAILSVERLGEVAGFDEALETLLKDYPNRDRIMRTGGGSGGGAWQPAERPTIRRSTFDQMTGGHKSEFIKAGGVVTD